MPRKIKIELTEQQAILVEQEMVDVVECAIGQRDRRVAYGVLRALADAGFGAIIESGGMQSLKEGVR